MFDRSPRPSPIPPLSVEARKRIEDAIERLMARLDADDERTEDLEPGGDDEPSLGAPESVRCPDQQSHRSRAVIDRSCDQGGWARGGTLDFEHDASDDEPALGSGAVHELRSQEAWSHNGGTDEREEENEHGSDEDAGEPSLGATTAINQTLAWAPLADWVWDASGEGEPSLAWTGIGRGHPETVMRGYDLDREQETL